MHVVRILTVYEFNDGTFDVVNAPYRRRGDTDTATGPDLSADRPGLEIDQSVTREVALAKVVKALEVTDGAG